MKLIVVIVVSDVKFRRKDKKMKDKDLEKIYVVRADLAFWSYATIGVATDLKSAKEMAMKFIANYPEITKAVAEHNFDETHYIGIKIECWSKTRIDLKPFTDIKFSTHEDGYLLNADDGQGNNLHWTPEFTTI